MYLAVIEPGDACLTDFEALKNAQDLKNANPNESAKQFEVLAPLEATILTGANTFCQFIQT
jgi:hypothetical protein